MTTPRMCVICEVEPVYSKKFLSELCEKHMLEMDKELLEIAKEVKKQREKEYGN